MTELTLVTAYFNIGRENWTGFNRGDENYISYFKHWARIRNKLIVYTAPFFVNRVMEVRATFGLQDRTTVIPIEDVTQCAPDLYQSIKTTMSNKESWLFHKKLDHPESWNYDYNYVTGLKPYWVCDAIQRGLVDGTAAWIDFGYDHGGEEFPNSEDFDFLWQYDFEPLIHIALAKNLDKKPIFKIVQDMDTYTRGNITVAPLPLWKILWDDTAHAIRTLSECGLADDDQTLMVMAYRKHPKLFSPHMTSYWGEFLKRYGNMNLRIRPIKSTPSNSIDKRFKRFIKEKRQEWDISCRHGKELEKKLFK